MYESNVSKTDFIKVINAVVGRWTYFQTRGGGAFRTALSEVAIFEPKLGGLFLQLTWEMYQRLGSEADSADLWAIKTGKQVFSDSNFCILTAGKSVKLHGLYRGRYLTSTIIEHLFLSRLLSHVLAFSNSNPIRFANRQNQLHARKLLFSKFLTTSSTQPTLTNSQY
jgi:hypothetical protein